MRIREGKGSGRLTSRHKGFFRDMVFRFLFFAGFELPEVAGWVGWHFGGAGGGGGGGGSEGEVGVGIQSRAQEEVLSGSEVGCLVGGGVERMGRACFE